MQPSRADRASRASSEVRVARFGMGEVALASAEQVAILFPDGRTRTFMSGYVKSVRRAV